MARSLEELELAFQAEYPKVDKEAKSRKAFRNKTEKAVAKETSKDIATAQKETIQDETTKEGIIQKEVTQQDTTQKEVLQKKNLQAESVPSDTISISILDILFYLVLVLMVVGAIIFSQEALGNRTIGGRHFYEVTSTSMQSVYPKGSIVFVRDIEPSQLAVGDDIVFLNEVNEFITSRITVIEENHEDTGEMAFITAGVDDEADNSKVAVVSQIRGKVTGSIPLLGVILSWIGGNLWLALVILGLILLVTLCVKIFGRKDKNAKKSADKRKDKVTNESKGIGEDGSADKD